MKVIISEATKKNWNRLKVSDNEVKTKLTSGANKVLSKKHFIPTEYFTYKDNLTKFTKTVEFLKTLNIETEKIIYNLALNILSDKEFIKIENNIIKTDYTNILSVLSEFKTSTLVEEILNLSLKTEKEEDDLLGLFYQSLSTEGDKNIKGSYYTPKDITNYIVSGIQEDVLFLDPCCGTGSFLLKAADKIKNPDNLYGFDTDRLASIIAKINIIMKYKDKTFIPKIYNINFLEKNIPEKLGVKFDIIGTNPPWGAKQKKFYKENCSEILSGESFSCFIVQAKNVLKDGGQAHFVLPESILNVKVHKDIRSFILKNFSISEIKLWDNAFKKVLTKVITINLVNKKSINQKISIEHNNDIKFVSQEYYKQSKNNNFMIISDDGITLIKKIYSIPHYTLSDSLWGLGIVTGDNQKHLSGYKKSLEKIYTGKDILPYILKSPKNYIRYNRALFQQIAPDEIYRADEKLIYKFVSKNLVFAYDDTQALVLNSANVLIPKVKTHSTKTVLAFLNSSLFNFLYKSCFNELKILKGNLLQLPFPKLNNTQKDILEELVNNYLKIKDEKYLKMIDNEVYKTFNLNKNDIDIIKQ